MKIYYILYGSTDLIDEIDLGFDYNELLDSDESYEVKRFVDGDNPTKILLPMSRSDHRGYGGRDTYMFINEDIYNLLK